MHRRFSRIALALAALLAVSLPVAQAARVKLWHHHTPGHFDKATLTNVVVSSEGTLHLARELKVLANLDVTRVWDVVEDRHGNLYVATGDEGKLYRVDGEGKATVVYTSPDSQIFCLALGEDGAIYAGTGPSGSIVRVSAEGKARVIAEGLDNYVWSLAFDADSKTVYAGTGPKGRVYQVPHGGKASVFFATKQDHILCLARGIDGMLYAGTDKGGLVYKIDDAGRGTVIHSAAQGEVRSILVCSDGVYAGTSSPVKRRPGASGGSGGAAPATAQGSDGASGAATASQGKDDKAKASAGSEGPASESEEPTKKNAAAAPTPPAVGENSLYRIAADGGVRELFREKAMVLSLLRKNGRVLVGTGMQGQLFEIDEKTKERSEIARLDHGQIQCLCLRKDGSIVLGAGDPGKLYVLQDRYASTGTVVSEVLDAKLSSTWGTLSWKASTPAGTRVSIAVRSGNTAEPDDTWSDWSIEQQDAERARIAAPAARYLQYRVTLKTEQGRVTPTVRNVALRYATANQAPEITSLEVPDLDVMTIDNPKKLKLKWTATDPNEDELTYTLYIRKEGWPQWVKLEDNLDKTSYEWDATTAPSGLYRVKVVASDRRDNPAESALTAERVSAAFPVAHTPPTVKLKVQAVEGERATLEAVASDPLVRLTEAAYSINGKKWTPVFPVDGLFDGKEEEFRFQAEALRPGTYVVVLRVRDAAGNVGTSDVVFTIGEKKGDGR